jgi:betaine-aldehyde dehydrogenase
VLRFADEAEAIRLVNDSNYGLAACVFTEGANRGPRVVKSIEAGTVCVNYGVKAVVRSPFGGYKQSGVGKEHGREVMVDDTQLQTDRVFHG